MHDITTARRYFESALLHFRRAGADRQVLNIRTELDTLTLLAADVAEAVESMRETLALVRSSAVLSQVLRALALGNLFSALTEQGEIDEALSVAREGIPAMREVGWFFHYCDHLSLRLAKAGNTDAAARLLGYTEAERARCKNLRRDELQERAYQSLLTMLNSAMSPAELGRCLAEGAELNQEEAAQLALQP